MSNKLENSRVLILGASGFIGGFLVKEILKEPVKEVILYDNFTRGKIENIEESLKDPRCKIFPFGGDIRECDVLDKMLDDSEFQSEMSVNAINRATELSKNESIMLGELHKKLYS